MRVVFWGTPDFATPPLRGLLGEGFDVVGVVTQPDRPVGRSRETEPPPVKRIAVEEGLPVLQPERPRGDAFLQALAGLAPDVSVVVAYGNLLPGEAIQLPRLGTLNIHASLLPKLRGAAPIQRAILEGLDETGVTVMRMVRELDAGPILLQQRLPIHDDETYGELSVRISEAGTLAIIEALTLVALGQSSETPQDPSQATYAPKIDRERTRIDWHRPAREVARAIRAFDPKPGAFSTRHGIDIKMYGARAVADRSGDPGEVLHIGEGGMLVGCGADREGGAVRIAYVHPAGKRRMAALDWAQGRGVAVGDRFGR